MSPKHIVHIYSSLLLRMRSTSSVSTEMIIAQQPGDKSISGSVNALESSHLRFVTFFIRQLELHLLHTETDAHSSRKKHCVNEDKHIQSLSESEELVNADSCCWVI